MARPWKFLFVSSDDLITEWRQRWSIDRFAFLFGMSFALGICILKRINLIDDLENGMTGINGNGNSNGNINNNSSTMPNGGGSVGAEDDYHYQDMATSSLMNLKTSSNSSSSRFGIDKKSTNRGGQLSFKAKFVFVLLAIAGMGSYYLFAVLCTSRESCDNYTTFITVIPVWFNSFYKKEMNFDDTLSYLKRQIYRQYEKLCVKQWPTSKINITFKKAQ